MANKFTTDEYRALLASKGIDITIGANYAGTGDASDPLADLIKAIQELQTIHNDQADGVTSHTVAAVSIAFGQTEVIESPPNSGNLITGKRISYSIDTFDQTLLTESHPIYV